MGQTTDADPNKKSVDGTEEEPTPITEGVVFNNLTLTGESFLNLCYERDRLDLETTGEVINYIIEDYFSKENSS